MHTDNNARSNAAVFVVEKKTKEVIQTIKRDQTPPHLCLKEHQIRYYHESCEKLKTIILYMGKNLLYTYGRLPWEFLIQYEAKYSIFKRP